MGSTCLSPAEVVGCTTCMMSCCGCIGAYFSCVDLCCGSTSCCGCIGACASLCQSTFPTSTCSAGLRGETRPSIGSMFMGCTTPITNCLLIGCISTCCPKFTWTEAPLTTASLASGLDIAKYIKTKHK